MHINLCDLQGSRVIHHIMLCSCCGKGSCTRPPRGFLWRPPEDGRFTNNTKMWIRNQKFQKGDVSQAKQKIPAIPQFWRNFSWSGGSIFVGTRWFPANRGFFVQEEPRFISKRLKICSGPWKHLKIWEVISRVDQGARSYGYSQLISKINIPKYSTAI